MIISVEDLKKNKTSQYDDGYRIVYFYDDKYSIGEYCKTIEGFMIGFADVDPIIDEDDIPQFVSTDDLLDRCLKGITDITGVAIYDVDGNCIAFKKRDKNKSI